MVDASTAAVLHSTRRVVRNPEKPIQPAERKKAKKSSKKEPESEETTEGRKTDALDRILRAIYER
jgi:hypothetical protein